MKKEIKPDWDWRGQFNLCVKYGWPQFTVRNGFLFIIRPKLVKILFILLAFTSCKKSEIKPDCYICQVKVGSDLIVAETRCTPQQPQVFLGDTTVICKLKK